MFVLGPLAPVLQVANATGGSLLISWSNNPGTVLAQTQRDTVAFANLLHTQYIFVTHNTNTPHITLVPYGD